MPVYGVPETLAKLAQVGVVGNAGAEVAAREISEQIAESAKQKVPVDTGELQSSIAATQEGVEVGAEHWIYVEFGTYKMPAQPYIRPAADEEDGEDELKRLAAAIQALG